MSSAHSSADIARAFLVTPPPDEDVCSHCSAYHTTIGRCLIKIREHQYGVDDRLDEVERQNSDAQFQRWRKQSSSPPTQLSGFDFLETKIDELPIQEIKTQVEDLDEKLENINDNLAVRMTKVEDKMEMLDTTVGSLEESLIEESQRLEKSLGNRVSDNDNNITRLNKKIELSITIARNVLVSRPLDMVPAMTFVHQEDGSRSEERLPSKKLKWWWKLHNADKRPQLIQVVQAMRFEWKEMLRELNAENSDTSSDEMDDDDNLDLPITTLQDMVRYRQKELVRAIFMHIGLDYWAIERKFNRAREGHSDGRSPKRQSPLLSGRRHAIRRRTPQGEVRGSSYWGSPTIENELPNPALSSTSAGSGV